jgi:type II secretory pathway component PulM
MDISKIIAFLETPIVTNRIILALAVVIIAYQVRRWSVIINRIPEKEWFDEVKISLKTLAYQSSELAKNTTDILDLRHELDQSQFDFKLDHELLSSLVTAHNINHQQVIERRMHPRLAVEESK